MEIKAKLSHLRISSRKVRLVADLIRGMELKEAENQLKFIPKRSGIHLLSLLNSAAANAHSNLNLEKKDLYIKTIFVNQGPPFKRWRAASRGRAMPVAKRTSHINLVLGVKEGVKIEKISEKTKSVQKDSSVSTQEIKSKPEKVTIKKEDKKEVEVKKSKTKKEKAPKKIDKKPKFKGLTKKIFRRKSF